MMATSRFKIRTRQKSNDISEPNIKILRFKTEEDSEARDSTNIRYSISSNLKCRMVPTNLLD